MGNVCEGKPSKHGVRVILLSHTQETEPSPQPLSTHFITGQWGHCPETETKTERPLREVPFKCLMHQAAEKDPSQGGPLSA